MKILTYFCECLSIPDHFATVNADNLYQSIKEIFKKQKPVKPGAKKSKFFDTAQSEQTAG